MVRHSVELMVVRMVTLPPIQSVCFVVSQDRVKVKSTIALRGNLEQRVEEHEIEEEMEDR